MCPLLGTPAVAPRGEGTACEDTTILSHFEITCIIDMPMKIILFMNIPQYPANINQIACGCNSCIGRRGKIIILFHTSHHFTDAISLKNFKLNRIVYQETFLRLP